MRLLKYLNEKVELGYDKKLMDAILAYVDTNNKKYLTAISRNKKKIPPQFQMGNVLYRGMTLDDKDYINLTKGKFKLNEITSWTDNYKIAKDFVISNKYMTTKAKNHKVILKKYIPNNDILLNVFQYITYLIKNNVLTEDDIDPLVYDSLLKERETLVNKIAISEKEFEEVK